MSEDPKFARAVDDAVLNGTLLGAYRKGLRDGRVAERERCAKIAETCPVWLEGEEPMPELRPTAAITRGRIAAAIRAGGSDASD